MKLLANTDQIRRADQIQIRDYHFPGIILMENAGQLAAEKILELYPDRMEFLILAGPGNNGGDGLVIARYLYLAGKEVSILLSHSPERYKGDALINWNIIRHFPIPVLIWREINASELINGFSRTPVLIDALLGTGISAQLRAPVADIISHFLEQGLDAVAIDLPSGLDASSGEMINEVLPAAHTLTFGLAKICHYVHPASEFCGEIHVLDIGLWPNVIDVLNIRRTLVDANWAVSSLHKRPAHGHKGTFGHLLLVGGSRNMAGAITLSALAALNSGAGLVSVFAPESVRLPLLANVPEAMCISQPESSEGMLTEASAGHLLKALEGKDAVVLGPGLGLDKTTIAFVKKILPHIHLPLILDADGLNILASVPELWQYLPEKTILTPHPGEMRRLQHAPDVMTNRLEAAENLAKTKEKILILKGRHSLSCLPDGRTFVNLSGNAGMATAGSGDVLSGLLGSLLAQAYPPEVAAPLGVWLHGDAGDRAAKKTGPERIKASDIANQISLKM